MENCSIQFRPIKKNKVLVLTIAHVYRATVDQMGEDGQPAQVPRVCTPRARAPRALGPWWSPRTRHQWRSSTDPVTTGRSVYDASTSLRENRTRGIYRVSLPRPSSQALRLMLREPRTPGSRRPERPLLSDRVADASRLRQIMQPDCQKASSFFFFRPELPLESNPPFLKGGQMSEFRESLGSAVLRRLKLVSCNQSGPQTDF